MEENKNIKPYQGKEYEMEVGKTIVKDIDREIIRGKKNIGLREIKSIAKVFNKAKQTLSYDMAVKFFFEKERQIDITEIVNVLDNEGSEEINESEKRLIKLCLKRGKVDDFSKALSLLNKITNDDKEKEQIINGIYVNSIKTDSAYGNNSQDVKKFNFNKKLQFIQDVGEKLNEEYLQEVCESEQDEEKKEQLYDKAINVKTGNWNPDENFVELFNETFGFEDNGGYFNNIPLLEEFNNHDTKNKIIKQCGKEDDSDFLITIKELSITINANQNNIQNVIDELCKKNNHYPIFSSSQIEEIKSILCVNDNNSDNEEEEEKKTEISKKIKNINLRKIKAFFIIRTLKQIQDGLITKTTGTLEIKRILGLQYKDLDNEMINIIARADINDLDKITNFFSAEGNEENIFYPTKPPFLNQSTDVKDVLFLNKKDSEEDLEDFEPSTMQDSLSFAKDVEIKEVKIINCNGIGDKVLFNEYTNDKNKKCIAIYFDIYNQQNKEEVLNFLLKNKDFCKKIHNSSIKSIYDFSRMVMNVEQMTEKTDNYDNVMLANLTRNRCDSIAGFELIDGNVINTGLNGKGNSVSRIDLSDKTILCSGVLKILESTALSNNPVHEIEVSVDDVANVPKMLEEYNKFLNDKVGSKLLPLRLRINSSEVLTKDQVKNFSEKIKKLEKSNKICFQSIVINNASLSVNELDNGIVITCNETYDNPSKKYDNDISRFNSDKNDTAGCIQFKEYTIKYRKSKIEPNKDVNINILQDELGKKIGNDDLRKDIEKKSSGGNEVDSETQLENQQENQQDRDVTALMNLYRKPEMLDGYSDDDIITEENCVNQMKKLLSPENRRLSNETKDFLLTFVEGQYGKFSQIFKQLYPINSTKNKSQKGYSFFPYGFTPEAFVASIANFFKCGNAINYLGVGDQRFSVKKLGPKKCVLHFSTNIVDDTPDSILSIISPLYYDVNTTGDNAEVETSTEEVDSIINIVKNAIGDMVNVFIQPIKQCHGQKTLIDNKNVINNAVMAITKKGETKQIFKNIANLYLSQIQTENCCNYTIIPIIDISKFIVGFSSFCSVVNEYIDDGFFTHKDFEVFIRNNSNNISQNPNSINCIRNILLIEKIKAIRSVVLNKIYKNEFSDGDIDIYDDKDILNYFNKHKQEFTDQDKQIMKNEFCSILQDIERDTSYLGLSEIDFLKSIKNGFGSCGLFTKNILYSIENDNDEEVFEIKKSDNDPSTNLFFEFSKKREILPDGRFAESENLDNYWKSLIKNSYQIYGMFVDEYRKINNNTEIKYLHNAVNNFCSILLNSKQKDEVKFDILKELFNKMYEIEKTNNQTMIDEVRELIGMNFDIDELNKIINDEELLECVCNLTKVKNQSSFNQEETKCLIKLLDFNNVEECKFILKDITENIINNKIKKEFNAIENNINYEYWVKANYIISFAKYCDECKSNNINPLNRNIDIQNDEKNKINTLKDKIISDDNGNFSGIENLTNDEVRFIDVFLFKYKNNLTFKEYTAGKYCREKILYDNALLPDTTTDVGSDPHKWVINYNEIIEQENFDISDDNVDFLFLKDADRNSNFSLLTENEKQTITIEHIEKKKSILIESQFWKNSTNKKNDIILLNDICIKHNNPIENILNFIDIVARDVNKNDKTKVIQNLLSNLQRYTNMNENFPCKLSEFLEFIKISCEGDITNLGKDTLTDCGIKNFKKLFDINILTRNNKLFVLKNKIKAGIFGSENFAKLLDDAKKVDEVHGEIKKIKGNNKLIFSDNTIQLILNSVLDEKITDDIEKFATTYKKLNDLYIKNLNNEKIKENILTLSSLIGGKFDENGGFEINRILSICDELLDNVKDDNFSLCANYFFEKIKDESITYDDVSGIAKTLGGAMLNSGKKHTELLKIVEKRKQQQKSISEQINKIDGIHKDIIEKHNDSLNAGFDKNDGRVLNAIKKPIKNIFKTFKKYIYNDNIGKDEITIDNLIMEYHRCFTLSSSLLAEDSLNLISQMRQMVGDGNDGDNQEKYRIIKRKLEFINSLVSIYQSNKELCNKDFEKLYKKSKNGEQLTEVEKIQLQATYSVKNIEQTGRAFRQEQMATTILTEALTIETNCFTKIPTGGGKTMSITHDVFNQLANNKIPFVVTTNSILVDEMVREIKKAYKPGKDHIYVFDANHNLLNVATQQVVNDLDREYEILNSKENVIVSTASQLNFYVDKRMLYGEKGIKIRNLLKKDGSVIVDEFDNNIDANSNNVISVTIKDQPRYDFLKYIFKQKTNIEEKLKESDKNADEINNIIDKIVQGIINDIRNDNNLDKSTDSYKQSASALKFIKSKAGNNDLNSQEVKNVFANSITQFIKALGMEKGKDFVIDNDKDGNKVYRPIIAGVPAEFGSKFNDQVDTFLKLLLQEKEGVKFEDLDKASKSINGGTNLLICDAFKQVHGYSGSIGNRDIQEKLWKKMGFSIVNLLPSNPKNVINKYSHDILIKDDDVLKKNKEGEASEGLVQRYTLFALCIAIKNSEKYKEKNYENLTDNDKKEIYKTATNLLNVDCIDGAENIVPDFTTYGFILGKDVRVEQDLFNKVKDNVETILNNKPDGIECPKFVNFTSVEKNINLKEYEDILAKDNNYIVFSTPESFRGVDLPNSPYVSTYDTTLTDEERIQANGRTGRSDRIGMTYTVIETNEKEIQSIGIAGNIDFSKQHIDDIEKDNDLKREFIKQIGLKNSQVELNKFLVKKIKCEIKNEAFVKATYLMGKLIVDAEGNDLPQRNIDDIQNSVFDVIDQYQSNINTTFEGVNDIKLAEKARKKISEDIDKHLLPKIAGSCKFDSRLQKNISKYIKESIEFFEKQNEKDIKEGLSYDENAEKPKNEQDRVHQNDGKKAINDKKLLKTHYIDDSGEKKKIEIQSNAQQDGFLSFNTLGSLFDCGFENFESIGKLEQDDGYDNGILFFEEKNELEKITTHGKKNKKDDYNNYDLKCANLNTNIFIATKKILDDNNNLVEKNILFHDRKDTDNLNNLSIANDIINNKLDCYNIDNTDQICCLKDKIIINNDKGETYEEFKEALQTDPVNIDDDLVKNFFISSAVKVLSSNISNKDKKKFKQCKESIINIAKNFAKKESKRIKNQKAENKIDNNKATANNGKHIENFYGNNLIKQKLFGHVKLAFQNKNNINFLSCNDIQNNRKQVIDDIKNGEQYNRKDKSELKYKQDNNKKYDNELKDVKNILAITKDNFSKFTEDVEDNFYNTITNYTGSGNDYDKDFTTSIKRYVEAKKDIISKIKQLENKISYKEFINLKNEAENLKIEIDDIGRIAKNVSYLIRQDECKVGDTNLCLKNNKQCDMSEVLVFNEDNDNKRKLQWINEESEKIVDTIKSIKPDDGEICKKLKKEIFDVRNTNIIDNRNFLNRQQRNFVLFKEECEDFFDKTIKQREIIFKDISETTETLYHTALQETMTIFNEKMKKIVEDKDISMKNQDLMKNYLCDGFSNSLLKQVFHSYNSIFNDLSMHFPEDKTWIEAMGEEIDNFEQFNQKEKETAKEIFNIYIDLFGETIAEEEELSFDEEDEKNKEFIKKIKEAMYKNLGIKTDEDENINKENEVKNISSFLEKYITFFSKKIQKEKERKNDLIHKIINDIKNARLFDYQDLLQEQLRKIGIDTNITNLKDKKQIFDILKEENISTLESFSKTCNNVKAMDLEKDITNINIKQREVNERTMEKIGIVILTILTAGTIHFFSSFQKYVDEVFNDNSEENNDMIKKVKESEKIMKEKPHNVSISLDKMYSVKELQANVVDIENKENEIPTKNLYTTNPNLQPST